MAFSLKVISQVLSANAAFVILHTSTDSIFISAFHWGCSKDTAYKPPLLRVMRELQDHIRATSQTTDEKTVETSLYGICRITKDA